MRNSIKQFASRWLPLLITGVTACVKFPNASSKQYEIIRFHRRSSHSQPCLVGYIDQPFDKDAWRVQYTIISADTLTTYPNNTGYYYRIFQAGKHTIRFGYIGLAIVEVKELIMQNGDSIQINVHMQQDTTRLRTQSP